MEKVSVIKCTSYDPGLLDKAISQSLENIGFDPKTLDGKRVGLKANLLIPSDINKAVITHPEFFAAAARMVKANGGTPVLIESPSVHSLERTLKKTPYGQIVADLGVEVADLSQSRTLSFEAGKKFKSMDIAAPFFDVDVIINLPKFKTHGLTYITGAVKNFLGAIVGLQKSKMHVKLPGAEEFSEFLLDLYGAMMKGFDPPKPVFHLMDAVVAQEGEGPGTAGNPQPMNAVIAGFDAVAMDWVAATAGGLDTAKAYTIVLGFQRDFCVSSPDDIEIVGDGIKDLGNQPMAPSQGSFMSNMIRWPFTAKWFKNMVIDKPLPGPEKCTLCYQCLKICPAGAISKASNGGKTPTYDYDQCIRCYCCMEVCPEAAIQKKKGPLQWLSRL